MTLEMVYTAGNDDLARVFVARTADGSPIEFVESIQPPHSRDEKWVLIVSTLKGCPVGCPICDAGGDYRGTLTSEEILAQVEYLVRRRYRDGRCPVPKLKVQFARMGDPALNDHMITVLRKLPGLLDLPGLLPCFSTVAPFGRDDFMEELAQIKHELYGGGRFQMQFSIHSTDEAARRKLIPIKTWDLKKMASFGDRFFEEGDRKITLNFAPAVGFQLDPQVLAPLFSPQRFAVKLTPINPTFASQRNDLTGLIDPADEDLNRSIAERFERLGYDTILSIGELDENEIGSNCGMYVTRMERRPVAANE